jgi:hypothetical protein
MFNWPWSKKPAEPPAVDRVWLNLAARDQALVRAAKAGPVLFIAFFDDTVSRVREALKAAGCVEGAALTVVRVDKLERPGPGVAIYLAERHPLPSHNRALLERLQRDAPGVVPVCFSALDEPFMLRFGGERVAELMKNLGMAQDEPVEHAMVSKSLANAREKIAKQVGAAASAPAPASSMAEWLQRHLPR